jgi:hypothetical protein
MDEFNYNATVMHCLREAIKMANFIMSRQSSPVIGPLSHHKALEFSQLLEKAYLTQISPVGINPHIQKEKLEVELPSTVWQVTNPPTNACFPPYKAPVKKKVKDMFPVTPTIINYLQGSLWGYPLHQLYPG